MNKILVLPDIHLHSGLVQWADKLLEEHKDWGCVSLGDWVDDWGASLNHYEDFLIIFKDFLTRHPNTVLLWGNHDYAYHAFRTEGPRFGCSGFTLDACDYVYGFFDWLTAPPPALPPSVVSVCRGAVVGPPNIVFSCGRTVFSHAGVSRDFARSFYERGLDMRITLEEWLNDQGTEALWRKDSPLWHRPSNNYHKNTFNPMWLQVVGHTPVPTVTYDKESNILYTDTWSTMEDWTPIGDRSLVVVDIDTDQWEVIPYAAAS